MKTRRADLALTYNGVSVTTQMRESKMEAVYVDPACDEADSLDINLQDRARQWITAWLPVAGDTMTASIQVSDWDHEGSHRMLPCGSFVLDDFSFSGWPITGTLSGVSLPADSSFRSTERTRTWEKVTIQQIGQEIAGKAGIALAWDVEGESFSIASVEQSEQTDCDFLAELCKTYGLCMKVYAQKIVIYDREAYKAKDAVATIHESLITSWSWKKSMSGTYTAGEFTYTDPKTEKEIKVTIGQGARVLKQSGKADSAADAERKLRAAMNEANHGASSISLSTIGTAFLVSCQCVTLVGIGKLSGKYYIDKITHHVGAGYTTDIELSLVADMTKEVMEDATKRLSAVGVMDTPTYWMEHYKDVLYLDGLILNMAARIKHNLGGSAITDVSAALTALVHAGVINATDYWASKHNAVAWLDRLIIRAANALTDS